MIKNKETVLVKVLGDISEEEFAGSFVVKTMLTHGDQLECDRIRREMIGEGTNPSMRTLQTADFLSQLAVRVITAPSWFTASADSTGVPGRNLVDDNVLADLYTAVMSVDVRVKKALAKQAEEAKAELAEDVKVEG